jgi:hypothetical protein
VVTGVAALVLVGALAACSSSDPTVSPPTAAPQSANVAPTTSASPSVSTTPLSPYENDPGVKALRKYYAAVSKAINARNLRLPELDAWSTPRIQRQNEVGLKSELGLHAPGPVRFTPVGVRSNGSNTRSVLFCVLNEGFDVDPKTGKPRHPREILAGQATLVRDSGRWKVDYLVKATFSCAGVPV